MTLKEFERIHAETLKEFELTTLLNGEEVELWREYSCEQIVTLTIAPTDLRSFFQALRSTEELSYQQGKRDAKKEIAKILGLDKVFQTP
jgi:hypothetical protein